MMRRCAQLGHRRLTPRLARPRGGPTRLQTSPPPPPSSNATPTPPQPPPKPTVEAVEKQKEEAPRWLKRMEPPKGGTKLPTPTEAAVIGVVVAAGYYAWFVADPPKKSEEADA